MPRPGEDSVLWPTWRSAQTCPGDDIESGSRTTEGGRPCWLDPDATTAYNDVLRSRSLVLDTRGVPAPRDLRTWCNAIVYQVQLRNCRNLHGNKIMHSTIVGMENFHLHNAEVIRIILTHPRRSIGLCRSSWGCSPGSVIVVRRLRGRRLRGNKLGQYFYCDWGPLVVGDIGDYRANRTSSHCSVMS